MNKSAIFYLGLAWLILVACKVQIGDPELMKMPPVDATELVGSYDNFLQYWKQNTNDVQHKDDGAEKHRHLHLSFVESDGGLDVALYEGRNNETFITSEKVIFTKEDHSFQSERLSMRKSGDTLYVSSLFDIKFEEPYVFLKCRYFSGWLQYPVPGFPDSIYSLRNLEMHDQGGMVELDIDGVDYTAELTQLEFAHTIKIMKLAIYDMPLDSVGINSRSISYTWTTPEAKRLGINLRKIISGWTFIEEGYINSNNLKQKK